MPDRSAKRRRPADLNKLAGAIVASATAGEEPDSPAVTAGRRGGLKGGRVRAKRLSAERRREIAKQAAKKRWRQGQ